MMLARRLAITVLTVVLGLVLGAGCARNDDSGMVDAPLMKNAPPPPPVPDKPTLVPQGAGGGGGK